MVLDNTTDLILYVLKNKGSCVGLERPQCLMCPLYIKESGTCAPTYIESGIKTDMDEETYELMLDWATANWSEQQLTELAIAML